MTNEPATWIVPKRSSGAAIAFKRKADGGDSADVADAMDALAVTLARREQFAAALELDGQSLAILSRVYGAESFRAARARSNRCEAFNSLGRHREALESCRSALPTFEATVGRDHQWVAFPLTATGIALLGLHRPDEALAPLRRAVDIRRRLEPNAPERGETWFALARAEWDRAIAPPRAPLPKPRATNTPRRPTPPPSGKPSTPGWPRTARGLRLPGDGRGLP